MKKFIIFALSLFVFCTPTLSYAADYWTDEDGNNYGDLELCEEEGNGECTEGWYGGGGGGNDSTAYWCCSNSSFSSPYTYSDCVNACDSSDECIYDDSADTWYDACENYDTDPCTDYTDQLTCEQSIVTHNGARYYCMWENIDSNAQCVLGDEYTEGDEEQGCWCCPQEEWVSGEDSCSGVCAPDETLCGDTGPLNCSCIQELLDSTDANYEYACDNDSLYNWGLSEECTAHVEANAEAYSRVLCAGQPNDIEYESYDLNKIFAAAYEWYGVFCPLESKGCEYISKLELVYESYMAGEDITNDLAVSEVCGHAIDEAETYCEKYFTDNFSTWLPAVVDSYNDDTSWIDAADDVGLSCTMPAFRPNCLVLKNLYENREEIGLSDTWWNDVMSYMPYVEGFNRYSDDTINWAQDKAYLFRDEYADAAQYATSFEEAADNLGVDCSASCAYGSWFSDMSNAETSTDRDICDYNFLQDTFYDDETKISRILLHCAEYSPMWSQYDNEGVLPEDFVEVGDALCYGSEELDRDEFAGHDCQFARGWWEAVTQGDIAPCSIDDICSYATGGPETDDYEQRKEYYMCTYNLAYYGDGDEQDWGSRCDYYEYRFADADSFDDFARALGITCADACGQAQYLKRGQCYECSLPTSKYENFFAGWTSGTTNCAHTYNLITNAGLKIQDLKCELTSDYKNWKCTVSDIVCGGGYTGVSNAEMGISATSTEDVLGLHEYDNQGRMVYEITYDEDNCDEYGDTGECLMALDYVYAYYPDSQCTRVPVDVDEDYYICENPISGRAIDLLRCDKPVPAGYYGTEIHSWDQLSLTYNISKCSLGRYQDKTGQTDCKLCPAFIKDVNGSLVYGTTASTGASSVSMCYIPSNYTFKAKRGTYHFTPQCNYSN